VQYGHKRLWPINGTVCRAVANNKKYKGLKMYQAGWGRQEIGISPRGYAMHGFGKPGHRAYGQETPLYARSLVLIDTEGQAVIFCCLDLGYVTQAMRAGAVERLQQHLGEKFNEAGFVLTCTHTHSGPGGCSHDVLYNLVTPGFVPEHLEAVILATVDSVVEAWQSTAPTELSLASAPFDEAVPVAWNRSLNAWNRNPDVPRYREGENHKALERQMQVLRLVPVRCSPCCRCLVYTPRVSAIRWIDMMGTIKAMPQSKLNNN
jgi:neutral ceramidase